MWALLKSERPYMLCACGLSNHGKLSALDFFQKLLVHSVVVQLHAETVG